MRPASTLPAISMGTMGVPPDRMLDGSTRAGARVVASALACATFVSSVVLGGPALAAGHTTSASNFLVPASARVHGTSAAPTGTTTKTPASSTGAGAVPPTARTGAAAPPSARTGTAAPGGIPTPGSATPTTTPTTATAVPGRPTAIAPTSRSPGGRGRARSGGKLSRGALIGAALAGLLVLLCAVWAAIRWLAVEPRWARSLGYSLEEAGFRASATWAELLDWARLGR